MCGCLDKRLQCKLLADPELTFAKALATAKAMETAERSAKDLHSDSTGQVHLMRRRPTRNRRSGPPKAQSQVSSTCSRCGAAHSPDSCKYKSATCHYCKKPGHLAKVCRKKVVSSHSAAAVTTATVIESEGRRYSSGVHVVSQKYPPEVPTLTLSPPHLITANLLALYWQSFL